MADLTELAAIAQLEERLTSSFADLPPNRVSAAVQDARPVRPKPYPRFRSAVGRAPRPR
jgi:hypothetical protein